MNALQKMNIRHLCCKIQDDVNLVSQRLFDDGYSTTLLSEFAAMIPTILKQYGDLVSIDSIVEDKFNNQKIIKLVISSGTDSIPVTLTVRMTQNQKETSNE